MANRGPYPIIFQRLKDNFGEEDWQELYEQSFGVGQNLEAFHREANAKGMVLVVQTSLVPADNVFPPPAEDPDGEDELG